MNNAFIIMQIGNPELDEIYEKAIIPAINACNLNAKRVDKHNAGGLLKTEIIEYIEKSQIIIADLTNERPNCYLEIGYAMGIDKFKNLILTAREDHNPDSPNYKKGGPKIHFDLVGYDILFWSPAKKDEFKKELEKRIRRRQAIILPVSIKSANPWDEIWINEQRENALAGIQKYNIKTYMEIRFALNPPKIAKSQRELLEAARLAPIHIFGWPIGVVLDNRDEYRPRPTANAIKAEVDISNESYDYWTLRCNGDFYLLKNIFEDQRKSNSIFFNTRIIRTTETILYCMRLYNYLNVDKTSVINFMIRYSGIKGRRLTSVGSRYLHEGENTTEDEIESSLQISLDKIESQLVSLVKELVKPLFILFDYIELHDSIYEDIVNNFVNGKVT